MSDLRIEAELCPACHHRDHDPGSCEECPRCELHIDEALAWVERHDPASIAALHHRPRALGDAAMSDTDRLAALLEPPLHDFGNMLPDDEDHFPDSEWCRTDEKAYAQMLAARLHSRGVRVGDDGPQCPWLDMGGDERCAQPEGHELPHIFPWHRCVGEDGLRAALGRFMRRVGGLTVRFDGGKRYVRVPWDWLDDLGAALASSAPTLDREDKP